MNFNPCRPIDHSLECRPTRCPDGRNTHTHTHTHEDGKENINLLKYQIPLLLHGAEYLYTLSVKSSNTGHKLTHSIWPRLPLYAEWMYTVAKPTFRTPIRRLSAEY